ncbi:MAG: hypothetical protein EBS90_13330, partial [Betaproteobacteria bacterium]|nr:hypothetical protein [Betaproteobacteria bacterium]
MAEAMISLPVPQHGRGLTLETLLSDFFAPEIMRGENAVYCATCKRLTDARRNQSIKIPPSILVLQLLRFTCPKSFGLFWQTQKVHTRVRTPLTLDMGPYLQLTPKQLSAAYAAGGTMQRTEDGKDMPGTLSVLYTLAAMVEHDGPSPRAGHYWAYIPVVELEGGMAKWYRMDDQRPDLARSPLAFEAICDRPAYVVAYLPMNPALVSALSSAADVLPDALIPPAASTTAALSSFSSSSSSSSSTTSSPPSVPCAKAACEGLVVLTPEQVRAHLVRPLTLVQASAVSYILHSKRGGDTELPATVDLGMRLHHKLPLTAGQARVLKPANGPDTYLNDSVINQFLGIVADRGKLALATAMKAGVL